MSKGLNERKELLLKMMKDPLYVPMKQKEIAIILDLPKERRPELEEALNELLEENKIELSKRGKYSIMSEKQLEGVFTGHHNGYGFVSVPDREEDIFIPANKINGAMHGDTVRISLLPAKTGKRMEGTVLKVIERANTEIVGYFEKNSSFGFVSPDNQKIMDDIFISKKDMNGAKNGDKVVVTITKYPDGLQKAEGKVIEILGNVKDVGVDVLSIARAYGLQEEFPEEVIDELDNIKCKSYDDGTYLIPEDAVNGRRDLRDEIIITIDGEDAKDLDDAISASFDGEFYHLGVHIADVSEYVREHSELDKEAYERATSVYLVDRVIPMLPRKLSNGVCSLNEGQDRLTLSCLMTIDAAGHIIDHEIVESVINSKHRMTYTAVNAIIEDENAELIEQYNDIYPMLMVMKDLADLLRKNRAKRGSIDFDIPETKVILDEKGRTIELRPYERNKATMLIEDFMLAANETVAEDYCHREIPFLYRTHDKPDSEKIEKLAIFINNFGYTMKGNKGEIHPKELQKLLSKIEGKAEAGLIMRLALRSMQQAKYTAANLGHFGLAANYYCHFTSPIRRYPDLQIHRIIKEDLHLNLSERRLTHYEKILDEVGAHCSSRERRADEVERETVKLKKIEYMEGRYGDIFTGVISGVTDYGLYVELPNTVEGLVRISEMRDDYYEYHKDTYELVGKANNKHYRLGQKVNVILYDIDKLMRTIDFLLVNEEENENETV